jgi:hypothetical protein
VTTAAGISESPKYRQFASPAITSSRVVAALSSASDEIDIDHGQVNTKPV